jgi:hypothetical protein
VEASGQWILGTVGVGKQKDGSIDSTGLKGLAIRLGDDGKKGIAYDLDLCRPIGAWSGKFTTEMNLMSRGDYPTAIGETIFVTGDFAGFMPGADATTLSPCKGFGPLPADQARFQGFHNAGRSVVVRWNVGGTAVDEAAEVVTANEVQFVVRTLEVAPSAKGLTVMLGKSADAPRIVTLGATATEGLLHLTGISRLRGNWQTYRDIPTMPTFHPSYLLHNNDLAEKRRLWEDMLLVMAKLGLPISTRQRGYFLK